MEDERRSKEPFLKRHIQGPVCLFVCFCKSRGSFHFPFLHGIRCRCWEHLSEFQRAHLCDTKFPSYLCESLPDVLVVGVPFGVFPLMRRPSLWPGRNSSRGTEQAPLGRLGRPAHDGCAMRGGHMLSVSLYVVFCCCCFVGFL